jgi:hypothetical protein
MRWLKHLSMAHEDPKLSHLLEAHGPEGYGVYWLLVETIAAPLEINATEASLTHSVAKWASVLHISARKMQKFGQILKDLNLISLETVDNRWKISVPNMLKYRDEYFRKSGGTREPSGSPSRAPSVRPDQTRLEQTRESLQKPETLVSSTQPATQSAARSAALSLEPSAETKSGNGNGHGKRVSETNKLPVSNTRWHELLTQAEDAKMAKPPADERSIAVQWRSLSSDDQELAIHGIRSRIESGEYSDPAYVPSLARYLQKRGWQRAVRIVRPENTSEGLELLKQMASGEAPKPARRHAQK